MSALAICLLSALYGALLYGSLTRGFHCSIFFVEFVVFGELQFLFSKDNELIYSLVTLTV